MLDEPAPDVTLPAWTPAGAVQLTLSEQRGAPVVHAAYGAKGLFGLPKRAVVVVDATGVVRWHQASQVGLTYADSTTIAGVLGQLVRD